MSKKRSFDSVSDMVHEASENRDFAKAFDDRLAQRQIVKQLVILRSAHEMSQKDIAKKIGCSQSRISKLENGKDADLRIGDLRDYFSALGLQMRITATRKGHRIVDEVKYHAFHIKHLLDDLAQLAGDDEAIAKNVAAFYGEAFLNLVAMIKDSASKLSGIAAEDADSIIMQMIESDYPLSEAEGSQLPVSVPS